MGLDRRGFGQRLAVDELSRVQPGLVVAPDELQQVRQRLRSALRQLRRVAQLAQQRPRVRTFEGQFQHLVKVASAPGKGLEVSQVVVAVADALVELGRGGVQTQHLEEVRRRVSRRTQLRDAAELGRPRLVEALKHRQEHGLERVCGAPCRPVVDASRAGFPARQRTRRQDAVGLIADAQPGNRTAARHQVGEVAAQRGARTIGHHIVEHLVEVVAERAGIQRAVHRDGFGVVGRVGAVRVQQRCVAEPQQVCQALAIGGGAAVVGGREPRRRDAGHPGLAAARVARGGRIGVVRRHALAQQLEARAGVVMVLDEGFQHDLRLGRICAQLEAQHQQAVEAARNVAGRDRHAERQPCGHGTRKVAHPFECIAEGERVVERVARDRGLVAWRVDRRGTEDDDVVDGLSHLQEALHLPLPRHQHESLRQHARMRRRGPGVRVGRLHRELQRQRRVGQGGIPVEGASLSGHPGRAVAAEALGEPLPGSVCAGGVRTHGGPVGLAVSHLGFSELGFVMVDRDIVGINAHPQFAAAPLAHLPARFDAQRQQGDRQFVVPRRHQLLRCERAVEVAEPFAQAVVTQALCTPRRGQVALVRRLRAGQLVVGAAPLDTDDVVLQTARTFLEPPGFVAELGGLLLEGVRGRERTPIVGELGREGGTPGLRGLDQGGQ